MFPRGSEQLLRMLEDIDNERLRDLLRSAPSRAIKYLYNKYYSRMVGFARSLTFDPVFSEDIVQDAFAHIWENRRHLSNYHKAPIENYLVRVVKFKSITSYKDTQQLNDHKIKLLYNYGKNIRYPNIETEIIEKEIGQEIRALIQLLPKREKECLLMRIDKGMDVDLIALNLKVTVKAVERSITSAKKRLRKYWLQKNKPVSWIF